MFTFAVNFEVATTGKIAQKPIYVNVIASTTSKGQDSWNVSHWIEWFLGNSTKWKTWESNYVIQNGDQS